MFMCIYIYIYIYNVYIYIYMFSPGIPGRRRFLGSTPPRLRVYIISI